MVIDGVVLAGGMSSRMGEDKALLKRDERDMLTYTADLVSSLPIEYLLISRNEAITANYLTNEADDCAQNYKVVNDVVADIGPLGGIYSVAIQSNADALIITPVDLPLLRKEDLEALINRGTSAKRPVYYSHHYLPLFLPLTIEIRQYLEDVVKGKVPQRSVNTMCTNFGAIEVTPKKNSRLTNVNTPAQWNAAKKLLLLAGN
ncbi:Molybdenum cofactor guanylyltransferase [Alteromonas sp. 38]|uniref:molybdenum cofactor guanylyltransferase n=1 Tax=Alteromonas TaxID=226 RepID=UPI0012F04C75|nr:MULTISPECIES: molybdenum cofactor guanylyltransferase [Alteromonas]CAD5269966.1 Molybdenum cofactor guanylyltransferase [Alteromonas sp. 154]VXB96743.1 Molybdenum cofactor guanylyltransferase [Alteromonas sp. 38]